VGAPPRRLAPLPLRQRSAALGAHLCQRLSHGQTLAATPDGDGPPASRWRSAINRVSAGAHLHGVGASLGATPENGERESSAPILYYDKHFTSPPHARSGVLPVAAVFGPSSGGQGELRPPSTALDSLL
jgi:hypothetical protein